MTYTRKALLICNPGEPGQENFCRGVYADMKNYDTLFKEAHGGYWHAPEIEKLERPTAQQVRAAVSKLAQFDYTFIAFSGHGYFSKDRFETILVLKKGEELAESELKKDAKRRSIVLDCCREIRHEGASERMIKTGAALAEAGRRVPNPQLCRAKFDECIGASVNGIVVAHSSSPGETSGDDEVLGGTYTSSLIRSANNWADSIARSNSYGSFSLSIVKAHEVATPETERRSGNRQHPRMEKPKTSQGFFPFAVFA